MEHPRFESVAGHMLTEEQNSALADLWSRYYSTDTISKSWDDRASVVTLDDVHMLRGVYESLPEDVRTFVMLHELVVRQYARGERCGVCGRTPAQSAAIGYDCIHEC